MKLKQVALIGYVIICVFATSALAAQMSVEPVYQEVSQGATVTVNIIAYPEGNEVYGANYALYFNNIFLNAISQEKGPFLTHDGASSAKYQDEINNNIGKIIYAESRTDTAVGVTDPGVLTTITFQVIGEERVSSLNLDELEGLLLCSNTSAIPTTVNNGSVEISETPKFVISGFVEYDSGDQVLDPDVTITNLNTGGVFVAVTNADSNHYKVSTDYKHMSSNDELHFDVGDDLGNVTEFNHTVTQDEMDAGGFVRNIMLYIPDTTPSPTHTLSTTATMPPMKTSDTTPTAIATATATSTISPMSSPSSSPIVMKTQSEEKAEENKRLPGFEAAFTIIGLFVVLISKKRM